MATTKSSRPSKSRAARPAKASLASRTGRTIKERPYTSAAIATGAVTAIAAAAAGAFFFRRSDKSLSELAEDVSAKIKSAADNARARFDGDKSQAEIAEEALTLKETGQKDRIPVDPLVEDQLKAGTVAY